jgi:Mn2+/Fe2+ NRAMP family transporter
MEDSPRKSLLATIGPGILLTAATVGAGDLLTSTLAGAEAGLALLWCVPFGIVLKWILSEGIARWQMATDTTLLEGWVQKLGGGVKWIFGGYLILFSFVNGGALATACGVAGTGFYQIGDPVTSKIVWGVVHSLVGLAIVRLGSFHFLEKVMSVCIGLMSGSMLLTAILIGPDWSEVARGLIPSFPPGSARWGLGVLGGIGGTLTLMSYGYWIREEGRKGEKGLKACRFDLTLSYITILIFGMSVMIIGSHVKIQGQGIDIALLLADQLGNVLGPPGRWIMLAGFWATVFGALLGVWQGQPYLFADFVRLHRGQGRPSDQGADLRKTQAYNIYSLALATLPLVLLVTPVKGIQLAFGMLASCFLPLLCLTLLLMNTRREWVGERFRTGFAPNAVLAVGLLFFVYVSGREVRQMLGW